jgi:methionyl-tRNA formyltransferase
MNKIIFLGYGEYGVATLSGLINSDYQLLCVITHPSKKDVINPVLDMAQKYGIEYRFSSNFEEYELVDTIERLKPDFIVSTNWRRRIPSTILKIPKIAALNVHDSLLPEYAGLSAEHWVIRNNEKETGVTVHVMSDIMDAGSIVTQVVIPINDDDTSFNLSLKQRQAYSQIIIEALGKFTDPKFVPIYKELKYYKRYHRITEADLQIKWEKCPRDIYNMLRSHSDPYPNCFFLWKNKKFLVKDLKYSDCSYCGEPGRVVAHSDEGICIATGIDASDSHNSGILLRQVADETGHFLDPRKIFPIDTQLN